MTFTARKYGFFNGFDEDTIVLTWKHGKWRFRSYYATDCDWKLLCLCARVLKRQSIKFLKDKGEL